jgi:hypothetical protein
MAHIYRVEMTTTLAFDLKADNKEQAQRWIEMHTSEDVFNRTKRYCLDETSKISYEYSPQYDDEDIDISTEEEEDR